MLIFMIDRSIFWDIISTFINKVDILEMSYLHLSEQSIFWRYHISIYLKSRYFADMLSPFIWKVDILEISYLHLSEKSIFWRYHISIYQQSRYFGDIISSFIHKFFRRYWWKIYLPYKYLLLSQSQISCNRYIFTLYIRKIFWKKILIFQDISDVRYTGSHVCLWH